MYRIVSYGRPNRSHYGYCTFVSLSVCASNSKKAQEKNKIRVNVSQGNSKLVCQFSVQTVRTRSSDVKNLQNM